MNWRTYIIVILILAATSVVVSNWSARLDLTEDKRYSLSDATKTLMHEADAPINIRILLDGHLNPSFLRLKNATIETARDLARYGTVYYEVSPPDKDEKGIVSTLSPTIIHERQQQGQMVQTPVFPYAILTYKGRQTIVPLLKNTRGLSGEDNVNQSIEQLEFAFAEAIMQITKEKPDKIAFIEGHGELDERFVYDFQLNLSKYFQIDRGTFTGNPDDLNDYSALIIADPQEPFSEADKYQIDHYVMQGGKILWLVDGVTFSEDILSKDGFTPVIRKDLNLQDLFFRYGIRITPTLLQDKQCLPIPVDVSRDAEHPNFQPMPWYYAPLLLTSQSSPITHNLGSVSSLFCSGIEPVGEDDGLYKEVLLATSSASRAITVPAEVNLSLMSDDDELFTFAYIPVGVLVEGTFPSLFRHRMVPEGVTHANENTEDTPTRQIFIACGSIIRNDYQQSRPLPLGYDKYTGMQFANKDFLTNAILYLTDNRSIINLRSKDFALRLLNDNAAHAYRTHLQVITCLIPLLILLITGLCINITRYRRAQRGI